MLAIGQQAPSFTLPDQDGKLHHLSDYAGKRIVLYFYPKDDTPGCTTEACDFRDFLPQLQSRNTVVLGVSPDDGISHTAFREKHALPFPLLSDVDNAIATAYGAYGEKKNYGKTTMGILRSTFIIDTDGTLLKIYRNVRVDGHVQKILQELS